MLLLMVVVIVVIVIDQLKPSKAPQLYLTQEECEGASAQTCELVLCDFIPIGKTFEETCGKNFIKHWEPRQTAQETNEIGPAR